MVFHGAGHIVQTVAQEGTALQTVDEMLRTEPEKRFRLLFRKAGQTGQQVLPDQEMDFLLIERNQADAGRAVLKVGNGQIQLPLPQTFDEPPVAVSAEKEIHTGIFLSEFFNHRRQEKPGTGGRRTDAELSRAVPGNIRQRAAAVLLSLFPFQGIPVESLPRIGQLQPGLADHELHAELLFQRSQTGGERLLGDVKLFRRTGEIFLPGQPEEVMNGLKIHGNLLTCGLSASRGNFAQPFPVFDRVIPAGKGFFLSYSQSYSKYCE